MQLFKLIAAAAMIAVGSVAWMASDEVAIVSDLSVHTQSRECRNLEQEWKRTGSGSVKVRYKICAGTW
jgi:hypothetical protein